ncbi:MAG: hypothetical protein AMXMBFR45_07840 [Gammaproteobacteria bacterium]|nr:MAG: YcxB family protein [Pseudomonadota bacterium]MBC6945998.1 YcxB family protein [Gammaproteobacteria bacterium]MCL4778101.1 PH domain-containing protein [Gammaproteobacteria bacterium]MDL1881715.1 YcxB family protein [Gammaproteobacteria bacterium PRO2]GIK34951.1 MAG: hypothetical protein BroJett010_15100 [Gammaproteobacteria bacterium]
MPSRIGDPIPRKLFLSLYFYVAAGVSAFSAITAWRGAHGWGLPLTAGGIALVLLLVPNVGPRQHEFVQVDDEGVAVKTKGGVERVNWTDIQRVRIVTTNEGPWVEDVYFLFEAQGGHGCVVPHGAAVRIKLLEELQSRLPGVQDDRVIEAMGCTDNDSFTIWEKPGESAV